MVTTRGFADALRIGYQTRPDLFALDIVLPDMLYSRVIAVDERVRADGSVEQRLDEDDARRRLAAAHEAGLRSAAIVLLHGYRYPAHEARLAEIAAEVGFAHVSASHRVNPLIRPVPRGDTTVADAYLTPVLRRHVQTVEDRIGRLHPDHFPAVFGGAGGQHACRVADELGMSTVLVHPHAGVLSALGIGLADGHGGQGSHRPPPRNGDGRRLRDPHPRWRRLRTA